MQHELALIKRCAAGDRKAMETLVLNYQDFVFSCCMYLLKDHHAAEEATQDVFVKLYRFATTFRGDSSLKTWLYRVSRTTCLDMIRQRNRMQSVDNIIEQAESAARNDGETFLAQQDQHRMIQRLIGQLDKKSQVVLSLYYLKELSIEEVADMLELTSSNVKIILFRGRNKLKELMKSTHLKDAIER